MFTYLYDIVLPYVGQFFGLFTALAQLTPSHWLKLIELCMEGVNDALNITYGNYFTSLGFNGAGVHLLEIPFSFKIGNFIDFTPIIGGTLNGVLRIFFGPFLGVPMWLAIPLALGMWGMILGLIKLFVKPLKD